MKYWKPIQIAFPERVYPVITDEEKKAREQAAVLKGKYRYLEVEMPAEEEEKQEKQEKAPEPREARKAKPPKRKRRS